MEFEWDPAKALSNEEKHRIRFDAAVAVFGDADRIEFDVTQATQGEERRKVVGRVDGRLLSLVCTERAGIIRVISARRANGQEVRRYEAR